VRAIDIRAAVSEAAASLRAAGVDSPRVDAELLLAHVLRVERGRLLLVDRVAADELAAFRMLIARRVAREPLQHLTGQAAFRHLELSVGPGVFVPRPETELIVDAGLAALAPTATVVDLCSGSGAIALAIAQEVPTARVFAVERSPQALIYLRRNAAGSAVTVVAGDVGDDEMLRDLEASVDLVVSNPPYVPADVDVSAETRRDPAEAVFAGVDGLDAIRNVVRAAGRLLRPNGLLVVEHDDGGSGAVLADGLRGTGWLDVRECRDLADRPRYVTARRPAGSASGAAAWGRMTP